MAQIKDLTKEQLWQLRQQIIAKLPSILAIDFYEDSDYPYPQVRAHL